MRNSSVNFKHLLFCSMIGIVCCLLSKLAYAVHLDMQVSADKIAFGDAITITYTLNSDRGANKTPDFSVFDKNFRVFSTNYGNAIRMVNGVTSIQTFWRLTLEPKNPGEIIIPAVDFGQVQSQPRKLFVVGTSQQTLNQNNLNEPTQDVITNHTNDQQNKTTTFVQAELSDQSPYMQSQVIYTFKLFYQSPLENPNVLIPQIKDATLIQLGEGSHYQTMIKGKRFEVAEKKFAIFPQKSGTMNIPPAQFRAISYDLSHISMNIMDDPFYMNEPKTIGLVTKGFTTHVREIPSEFNGANWLPAKNILLTEKWSQAPSTSWEVGSPMTRTVTVEAQGLCGDQIPDLTFEQMNGVNIYVDPAKRSNRIENDGVTGVLEQKVTYIASQPQGFTIPAVTLNWWNVRTNRNAISQLNTQTITVDAKPAHHSSGNATHPTNIPIVHSPASIFNADSPPEAKEGKLITPQKIGLQSIWFWVALFFFGVWLLTIYLLRKKNQTIAMADPHNDISSIPCDLPPSSSSEDSFAEACKLGNALYAQNYLLSWSKKEWEDPPLNLEKLRAIVDDEQFKIAVKNLEQAIYANKDTSWHDGEALWIAYQHLKKNMRPKTKLNFSMKSSQNTNNIKNTDDPLPPLYP